MRTRIISLKAKSQSLKQAAKIKFIRSVNVKVEIHRPIHWLNTDESRMEWQHHQILDESCIISLLKPTGNCMYHLLN